MFSLCLWTANTLYHDNICVIYLFFLYVITWAKMWNKRQNNSISLFTDNYNKNKTSLLRRLEALTSCNLKLSLLSLIHQRFTTLLGISKLAKLRGLNLKDGSRKCDVWTLHPCQPLWGFTFGDNHLKSILT